MQSAGPIRTGCPIYLVMMPVDLETKECPFCAETIQARAVKCRFCGEFLNTEKARTLAQQPQDEPQHADDESADDELPFVCGPSLLSLMPDVLKSLAVALLAGLLWKLPLERVVAALPGLTLTQAQAAAFASYRVVAALGLLFGTAVFLVMRVVRVRSTYYEVSADRIEWGRGLFDRKVDNIDMFRIVDMKLRRTPWDCLLGIGSIVLITSDKTEPEFVFHKVPDPRSLYDVVKKASLQADRRGSVIHLE